MQLVQAASRRTPAFKIPTIWSTRSGVGCMGGGNSFANPDSSASKASAWGVGINWYLSQNYKWSLNYDVTSFEGGAAAGGDRPDEKAVFTRFGLQF